MMNELNKSKIENIKNIDKKDGISLKTIELIRYITTKIKIETKTFQYKLDEEEIFDLD